MTYRLLDYHWHTAHGARLLQIPAEWTYFLMGDRPYWNFHHRELPAAMDRVTQCYEPGRYDAVILHLDQWCVGTLNRLRALPYRILNALASDVPKVVVMHGLPEGTTNRAQTWQLIGDNFLVTNTEMSRQMWGLPKTQSRAIVPGYDIDAWGPPTYRRNEIVVTVSGSNTPKDHHGVALIQRLKRDLPITWIGKDVRFGCFQDYRDYLASASIYLNPTQHSQHPGARNEAMLSGLAVVSTDYFDEAEYITHGDTGFLSHDYLEIRDYLARLLADREYCQRIGRRGREAARQMFDKRRYVAEWLQLLGELTGG